MQNHYEPPTGPAGEAPRSAAVQLARKGRSFTADTAGGEQVLVAVEGLPGGAAVISTFVLRHGVTRAWLLLGFVGLLRLVLSVAVAVAVADQLARSVVRPIKALALASDRLAAGDLSARAAVAGPPDVRRAGAGLNRPAVRIGELLAHERETVADLTHRLRTPLTALRIAEAGGTLVVGRSASGGGAVTLGLGSPAGPPETGRRHGRNRLRLRPRA